MSPSEGQCCMFWRSRQRGQVKMSWSWTANISVVGSWGWKWQEGGLLYRFLSHTDAHCGGFELRNDWYTIRQLTSLSKLLLEKLENTIKVSKVIKKLTSQPIFVISNIFLVIFYPKESRQLWKLMVLSCALASWLARMHLYGSLGFKALLDPLCLATKWTKGWIWFQVYQCKMCRSLRGKKNK